MRNSTFRKLEFNDYAKAYNDLEEFCIQNTDLLLYGEFGNASFPSISDLDVFICLMDQNFSMNRKKIIDFIDSDEIRQYLFFHDPLIIPESILINFKQFHTAYNLTLSYKKSNIVIPRSDTSQVELLNKIWTTYLMGISPGVLINSKFGVRDKLLVLKNICQSIANIDKTSQALLFSEEIRYQAIRGDLTIVEINEIFKNKLNELYQKSESLQFENSIELRENKHKVERNKVIVCDNQNSFSISEGEISIHLNPENFNFFSQFYNRTSKNIQIQSYIDNAIRINKLCKKMSIPYPFITPFGIQFYRNDLKFYIKKKFLAL